MVNIISRYILNSLSIFTLDIIQILRTIWMTEMKYREGLYIEQYEKDQTKELIPEKQLWDFVCRK